MPLELLFMGFVLITILAFAGDIIAAIKGEPRKSSAEDASAFSHKEPIISPAETAEHTVPDEITIRLTREQLREALCWSLSGMDVEFDELTDEVYAILYRKAAEDRSGSHERLLRFHAKLAEEQGESSVHDVEG